jgi:SnoaL-like domain
VSKTTNELRLSRRAACALPLGIATAAALGAGAASARSIGTSPSLKERAAIEDLFTAYVWAYDCNSVEGFLSLFLPDDPLVIGRGVAHRGREALAAWFAYLMDIRNRDDSVWLHQALHHSFRKNGDNWLVYSYATHFSQSPQAGTLNVRSLGYFVSELVHSGSEFRFRRFSINTWDRDALPWSKPLPWAQADAAA